ncbi:calcium-binding protein [Rubellimicrobium arenae]|uniref:calcium-binding protein n=1 Tax=Rubellimicrobium arenae TaxID=2817372 RepID=UPI001B305473|nr:calcium-binding protein [Rubellimicrobium arenae]
MSIIHGTPGDDRNDLGGSNLVGTGQSDTIYGYAGHDWLEGLGGNDYLLGGSGLNTIKAGGGYDYVSSTGLGGWFDGGAGADILDLSGTASPGAFDLALGSGRFGAQSPSGAGAFTMMNFESIYTGGGSDMLWGTEGNNEMRAGGGADAAYGRNGADTLRGEFGDDYLDGGRGQDFLNGGEGRDTLYGAEDADQLYGEGGEDKLFGGDGDDVLNGGIGSDVIDGLSGYDTMSVNGLGSGTTVDARTGLVYATHGGVTDIDQFYRIEKVVGSYWNDTIILTDTMAADASTGNDVVHSGSGGNSIKGGLGTDTVSYALSTAAVNVNLGTGAAGGGWATGDALESIENLTGSDFADTLRAGPVGSTLEGGLGRDKLLGSSGADRLVGGAGGDELTGGAGADRFVFRAQGDSPWQSNDHDVIKDFQRGVDKIDLSGIDANQHLSGNQAFDTLIHSTWPYEDFRFDAATIAISSVGGGVMVSLNLRNLEEGSVQHPYDAIEMSFTVEGCYSLDATDFIF